MSFLPPLNPTDQEYLERATPTPEELFIPETYFGQPNSNGLTIPQLLAHELDRKERTIMQTTTPYSIWANPNDATLQKAKFFDLANEYVWPAELTEAEQTKDTYPYKKYNVRHYFITFSRPAHSESQLKEIKSWLQPYYDYFYYGRGRQQLQHYYPERLNINRYKEPSIYGQGNQTRILRIMPAHISIAFLTQAHPLMINKANQEEIKKALKYALYCDKLFANTLIKPPHGISPKNP